MKLRYLHSSLKRTLTLFLGLLIFVSFTASAYAVEYAQTPSTLDALLDKINAEFGTNFHVITPEESRERYGFEIPYSNPAPMTKARLLELEEYFRHFAMVEIPKINKRTQEALAISASIEKAKQRGEEFTLRDAAKVTRATVVAEKAIDGATAGAIATTYVDSFQHTLWEDWQSAYCRTNYQQERWFLSINPTVSIIDRDRNLYWQGTGDYGAYINGQQVYIGSGTQYAYMYIDDYV